MKSWIINASPLILLGKIKRLELLEQLAPSFIIPSAVFAEILAGPETDPAKTWIKGAPGSAHVAPEVTIPPAILAWDLGAGESAVLALASTLRDSLCVLDDLAARNCAEVFQFPTIGTLGILLKARAAGLIPGLEPEIEKLLAVGSLLSPSVIRKALGLAGEESAD